MNYVVIGIIAILVIFAAAGFWRGLIKTVVGLASIIITLVATYLLTPYVSDFLVDHTTLYETIESRVYSSIESEAEKKIEESLKDVGVKDNDLLKSLTDEQLKEYISMEPDKATQVQIIDELQLPEELRTVLIENNNDSIYSDLGVSSFYKYLSGYSAQLIIKIISYALVFIVVRCLLMIVVYLITKGLDMSPVLSTANRMAGAAFGAFIGLLVVWIIMFVAGYVLGNQYDALISENTFLKTLSEYNVVTEVFHDIFK